jgi:hypothetical protein
MHWHTEGFVSLIGPASRIDKATDLEGILTTAVKVAYDSLGKDHQN